MVIGELGCTGEEEDAANDPVYSDDEGVVGLTWGDITRVEGAGEPSRLTRTQSKSARRNPSPSVGSSKGFMLHDKVEIEEDIDIYVG